MSKKPYYDHERAYKRLKEIGGKSFRDLNPNGKSIKGDFYDITIFLESPYCPEGGKALDLGCGGGQASFMLYDKGFDVLGLDYAETAVEIARKNAQRLAKKVIFERADILNLEEIVSETFDLVIDNHVSHCILPQDRERYFSEASRILKPGGVYFGTVMAIKELFKPEDLIDMDVDPETRIHKNGNRYLVTEKELIEGLVSHGLFPLSIKKDHFDKPSYMDLTVYAKKK
jgi:SAM-dependent methyltransferase